MFKVGDVVVFRKGQMRESMFHHGVIKYNTEYTISSIAIGADGADIVRLQCEIGIRPFVSIYPYRLELAPPPTFALAIRRKILRGDITNV